MTTKLTAVLAGSLVLAGGAGFLAAAALGTSSQAARTVTVNVGTGTQGPPGPAGPAGPKGEKGEPGGQACPAGFSLADLVINHPGGQVTLFTCIKD